MRQVEAERPNARDFPRCAWDGVWPGSPLGGCAALHIDRNGLDAMNPLFEKLLQAHTRAERGEPFPQDFEYSVAAVQGVFRERDADLDCPDPFRGWDTARVA